MRKKNVYVKANPDGSKYIVTFYPNLGIKIEKRINDGEHHIEAPERIYYENGYPVMEVWGQGRFHRDDGPAAIFYYSNGNVQSEAWYQHGQLHRECGPALVDYDPGGTVTKQVWCYRDECFDSREEMELKLELLGQLNTDVFKL